MKLLSLLCLFLSLNSVAWAGSLTAELDRTQVDAGDSAQLSVTISGTLKDDIAIPPVAGLTFQQIGTSTNVQIVNGSFSKETTYNFAVTADRAGTFQIPSIKASIDKEDMATPPLTVTFGAGGPSSRQAPATPNNDVANDPSKPAPGEIPFIFVEREWSKQDPYEGEAVLSTIRVFQRVRVLSMVPERAPSPAWRIISKEGQKSYETERDGLRWRVTELTEVLVPLKSGDLPSPSFALQSSYLQPSKQRIRRGSIWDLFQGGMMDAGQEVSKKISTPAKTIHVKPLPVDGKPSVVSDIVGDFKLTVDVSKRALNPGETATVSVRIAGRGALDRMAEVKLPALVGARVYPDKPQLKESMDETGLKSSKEYKFAIVPSQAGDQRLGTVELGVFNTITGKWETLKEDLGTITVSGTAVPSVSSSAAVPDITTAAEGTPPVQPNTTNHNQDQILNQNNVSTLQPENQIGSMNQSVLSKWFGLAVLLLGLVGCLLFAKPFMRRYREWTSKRVSSKTPYAALRSSVLTARKLRGPGVDSLLMDLKTYTAANGQDPKAMTAKDIMKALRENHLPDEKTKKLEVVLNSIESNSYRDADSQPDEATIDSFFEIVDEIANWEKA